MTIASLVAFVITEPALDKRTLWACGYWCAAYWALLQVGAAVAADDEVAADKKSATCFNAPHRACTFI